MGVRRWDIISHSASLPQFSAIRFSRGPRVVNVSSCQVLRDPVLALQTLEVL